MVSHNVPELLKLFCKSDYYMLLKKQPGLKLLKIIIKLLPSEYNMVHTSAYQH